jgi:hypothetical protein
MRCIFGRVEKGSKGRKAILPSVLSYQYAPLSFKTGNGMAEPETRGYDDVPRSQARERSSTVQITTMTTRIVCKLE